MKLYMTQLLPAAGCGAPEALDRVGFYALEGWGAADFDRCPGEDPWVRLDALRKALPNTRLQLTLPGRTLLGRRDYPDDLAEAFVGKVADHGMDILRVYDPLNDLGRLAAVLKAGKDAGMTVQGGLCWAEGPLYTGEYFADLATRLAELGAEAVWILDLTGKLQPKTAHDLIKAVKGAVSLPVGLHSPEQMTRMMALVAGVDLLDCTGGEAVALHRAARDMGLDTGLAQDALGPVEALPGAEKPVHDLAAALADRGMADRLADAERELAAVRADLGYPVPVAPFRQMAEGQALTNLLTGGRYRRISKEIIAYLRGDYGTPPGPVSGELLEKAGVEACKQAPLAPGLPAVARELAGLVTSAEELLTYLMRPAALEPILREREELRRNRCSYTIEEIG